MDDLLIPDSAMEKPIDRRTHKELRAEIERLTAERGVMISALRKIDDECLNLDAAEWEAREALKSVSGN